MARLLADRPPRADRPADPGPRARGLWSTRGVVLGAGGLSAAVAAAALGEPDLLRLGLFTALLPVASLAWTLLVASRGAHDLVVERHADPPLVGRGAPVTVHLRLVRRTGPRGPRGTVLAEDALPPGVSRRAAPPRLVLAAGEQTAETAYTLVPLRRGVLELGPTVVRIVSPLGLCDRRLELPGTSDLVVTPEVVPLPRSEVLLRPSGSGEGRRRPGAASAEDASVRPYRRGDDLRMVHWRSTARRGELQVREGQDLRVPRALVIVDASDDSPTSDAGVDLAATVGVHLLEVDHDVELHVVGDAAPTTRCASPAQLLGRLAEADSRPRRTSRRGDDTGAPGGRAAGGRVGARVGAGDVVVLCTHIGSDVATLAAALPPTPSHGPAIALVAGLVGGPAGPGGPPGARALHTLLTDRGWLVRHLTSARELPDVWREDLARSVGARSVR